MELIHCKDCAWFAPIESTPEATIPALLHEVIDGVLVAKEVQAARMHKVMQDAFGDVLPKRDGEVGICRKVTFSAERPVLTNENGYCHRVEKKEE